jgi:hypothetical protein
MVRDLLAAQMKAVPERRDRELERGSGLKNSFGDRERKSQFTPASPTSDHAGVGRRWRSRVAVEVVWRQSSFGKREIRRAMFANVSEARNGAELFNLSVPGFVEATIYDESGKVLETAVHDNA